MFKTYYALESGYEVCLLLDDYETARDDMGLYIETATWEISWKETAFEVLFVQSPDQILAEIEADDDWLIDLSPEICAELTLEAELVRGDMLYDQMKERQFFGD